MWRKNGIRFAATVLLLAAALGCGGPQPGKGPRPAPEPQSAAVETGTATSQPAAQPAPQDDSEKKAQRREALLADWKKAATSGTPATGECQAIASQLRTLGPEALLPLLDIMADPQETPRVKVAAADSLDGLVHPLMLDRLTQMTGPENDATSRACATHLLGGCSSPKLLPLLQKLASDPEKRVSFAALRGLAILGDPEGRKSFVALFDAPGTTVPEREQIGRVFSKDIMPSKENVPILIKILGDTQLSSDVRRLTVATLGTADDPAAIPALEAAAEKDPDQYIREIAGSAAKLIASSQNTKESSQAATSPESGANAAAPATPESGANAAAPATPESGANAAAP